MQLSHKNQGILLVAATAVSAFALGYLFAKRSPANDKGGKDKFETYHLGIETGGTSCKVGIMKGKYSLNIIHTSIIKTTTPEETVKNIC